MFHNKLFNNEILKNIAAVCIILIAEYVFFRNVIGHNFLIGDNGDGRLTTLLAEHWYNFFCGREAFTEIAYFYPDKDVLGYTDMFLGFGFIHSILRVTGLDMFTAYKYTIILVHLFGSLCMFYLLHSMMKCNRYWSLFGIVAFSYSNAYAAQLCHTQLAALSLLPLLTIFLIKALSSDDEKQQSIFMFSIVSLLAFIAYTAWYILFFTLVFGLILLVTSYIVLNHNGINCKKAVRSWLVTHKKTIIGCFIYSVVLLIPFLLIYLPALRNSGGYSFQGIGRGLPELIDLINVGNGSLSIDNGNWFFAKVIPLAVFNRNSASIEIVQGFSIVLLAVFLYIFFQRGQYREYLTTKEEKVRFLVINSCIISILVVIAITVKLGSDGYSLWYFMYKFFPGARAIRCAGRFWLFLSFPVAFVVAVRGEYVFSRKTIRFKKVAGAVLFIALFISNLRVYGINYDKMWRTDLEVKFLENIAKPPVDCTAFYIYDSGKKEIPAWAYQTEAFEIANHFGIKTVNGHSGCEPRGWGLWNVRANYYPSNVYSWIKRNDLKDIYGYDRHTNKWVKFGVDNRQGVNNVFWAAKGKYSLNYGMQGARGKDARWVKKHFGVVINNRKIKKSGLRVSVTTFLDLYKKQLKDLPLYIKLFVNGEFIADLDIINGRKDYVFKVPNIKNDMYEVELKTNAYFNPQKTSMSKDARDLSLAVHYIGN